MLKAGTAEQISKIKNLRFEFTNTLRNQDIDLNSVSGDFIINTNGLIYVKNIPKKNATIVLVGGLSTFVNEKIYREPSPYITIPQQQTLVRILKRLGVMYSDATVNSSNNALNNFVNEMYFNSKF